MKRIILIVDNDSDARNALGQVLEPEGHHIVQAESGEQALALALEVHVDVFLLAIETPRINGIMLCKELRAIDQYRKAPIILLTGSSADRRLHQALNAGGDDFIERIICRDNSMHYRLIVHDRDRQEIIFGDDLCNLILFIRQMDALNAVFHESFHRRGWIRKDQFLQGENTQKMILRIGHINIE